jgi:2-polyprenyl-3-methyl-5-hydroxy-6-metoxy-1,4-benzoquinol methylase
MLFSAAGGSSIWNGDNVGLHALSSRKRAVRDMADRWAPRRDAFVAKSGFHQEDEKYLRFLIPPGLSILDVGCGTGHLLATLNPKRGVGIDMSDRMVEIARVAHPQFDYVLGDVERMETIKNIDGKFDIILLHDTIGSLEDCQSTLKNLEKLCQCRYPSHYRLLQLSLGTGVVAGRQAESADACTADQLAETGRYHQSFVSGRL